MQVELVSSWGSDKTICDCARVSYNKKSSDYTEEQNERLIKYLISHKHTSVFRHPQIQFRITCPIYVSRQLEKHQTGMSLNSISGRYIDFSDSYTMINVWRQQSKSSKQGSEGLVDNQDRCNEIQANVLEYCKLAYDELLELGVSKEQARTILPLNLNTVFIWTGSLLAFIHLFNLRLKQDAQQETREVAKLMYEAIVNIEGNPFKHTLVNFNVLGV